MVVLVVIPPPKNIQVHIENKIIPVAKQISRWGHKIPSNATYPYFVALINVQLMGIPIKESNISFLLNEDQINCPLSWNHIINWTININDINIKNSLITIF